jgi:hypothetical protein
MRKFTMTAAVMGLGVLASGLAANAQYFNFSTSWSPTTIMDNGNTLTFEPGSSNGLNFAFPTGTDIVLANTAITGVGHGSTPIASGGYSVQVTLNETTAGNVIKQSVVDTFSGTLSGTFSVDGSGITNAYNNPTSITTTFADGYKYTVALDGFVPPQFGNGANADGSIGATVAAQAPVKTNSTPEPGALALLSGISVPGVILGARRRKKVNA